MGLRVDRVDARKLVADADRNRPGRESGERAVEVAAAVAEPVSGPVPAVDRNEQRLGCEPHRADRIRDSERPLRHRHPRMPLAKLERRARRQHHRQRRARPAREEPHRERARIVLAADRPAEGENRAREPGKRALDRLVDALTPRLAGVGVERLARREKARALGAAPGAKFALVHRRCYPFFVTPLRALTIAALVAATACAQAAGRRGKAPDAEEQILAVHAAWRAGDAARLARAATGLEGHPLAPWVEYWRLALRLAQTPDEDVAAFLARNEGSYVADRLRAEWLKELGRRGAWERFERELGALVQDDAEIRCYAWRARLARGDASAAAEARAIFAEAGELAEGCQGLAAQLAQAGLVEAERVWQRIRLLLESGQLNAARRAFAWLPDGSAPGEPLFALAANAPQRLLAQPPRDLARRPVREMVLFALARLAREDLEAAAHALGGELGRRLPEADRRYAWGHLGHVAARRLEPQALEFYRRAADAPMSDDRLAWKARAGLRAGDWQAVREAVDAMSALARREPVWSYWYARALAAQGNHEGARAYYLRHAGEPHFYGILAAEELGYVPAPPEPFHVADEQEVAAAARHPGLVRALALYRLGLRAEANAEWAFSVRAMDDTGLLAAAELARRNQLFDRAIATAERTVHRHNFRLRYLAPYAEALREGARAHALEEAWVLGLVRQESRFVANARSPAGAQGLMQLMPATASWVARKVGLGSYTPSRVNEPELNIALGTHYLKLVLEDLGHPVLALAAYNAGPARARRWRDPKPLEGAIYAETIPFKETRDYVKKVMANTVYYAQLLGGRIVPLRERLGVVPARRSGERANEELP